MPKIINNHPMSAFQTPVGNAPSGLTSDFIKSLYRAFFSDDHHRQAESDENNSPSESQQFSAVISKIANIIKRNFSSLTKEEIEDLVLEKLPTIANKFRGESAKELNRFVLRVVSNRCTDKIRGKNESSLDSYSEENLDPVMPEGIKAEVVHLHNALERLPEEFRAAIVLSDIEDLPASEAALTLGISVPAFKSRLYRGRKLLAQILTPVIEDSSEPTYDPNKSSTQGEQNNSISNPIYDRTIKAWRLFNSLGISDKNVADFLRSVRDLNQHPINKSLGLIPLPVKCVRIKRPTILSKASSTVDQVPEFFLKSLCSVYSALKNGNLTIIGKHNRIAPNTSTMMHLDKCVTESKKRAGNFRRSYQRLTNPYEIVRILYKRQIPIKQAFPGYSSWKENESRIDTFCGDKLGLIRRNSSVTPLEIFEFIRTGNIVPTHLYGVFKFADFIRKIERREILFYHPEKKFYTPEELKEKFPFRQKFTAIFLRLGPNRIEQLKHLNAERLRARKGEGETLPYEPAEKFLKRIHPILASLMRRGFSIETIPQELISQGIPNQRGIPEWTPKLLESIFKRLNEVGLPVVEVNTESPIINSKPTKSEVIYPERIRKPVTLEISPEDFFEAMYRVRNGQPARVVEKAHELFGEITHWNPPEKGQRSYRTVVCKRPITFTWSKDRFNPTVIFNQGDTVVLSSNLGVISWEIRDPNALKLIMENKGYKAGKWFGFEEQKQ